AERNAGLGQARDVHGTARKANSIAFAPADRTWPIGYRCNHRLGAESLDYERKQRMSNHFTGLSLGPPLGDQRLDLCDLYAFQSPADKDRTVIILNANPNADALHPEAIYRVNIDNDGDYLTDIAFSYVFSKPQNGRQTVDVFMAT